MTCEPSKMSPLVICSLWKECLPERMTAREGANGIGDIAAFESHSLIRDAVEVRSLYQFRSISTDSMWSVIIGEDEEDVGLLCLSPSC